MKRENRRAEAGVIATQGGGRMKRRVKAGNG
jgi:hypothetical protein